MTPQPTVTAEAPAVLNSNLFRPGQGSPLVLSFKAPEAGRVTVHVFNVAGERVRQPFEAEVQAGLWFQAHWDGRNEEGESCGAGVYVVSVQGAGLKVLRKVVLLK